MGKHDRNKKKQKHKKHKQMNKPLSEPNIQPSTFSADSENGSDHLPNTTPKTETGSQLAIPSFTYNTINTNKKRKRNLLEEIEKEDAEIEKKVKSVKPELTLCFESNKVKGVKQSITIKDIQSLILWNFTLCSKIPWIFLKVN
jgi:hypothetical protein